MLKHSIALHGDLQNWGDQRTFRSLSKSKHVNKSAAFASHLASTCVYVCAPRVDDQNTWPGRYLLFPPSSAAGTTYARLVRRPMGDSKPTLTLSLVWSHPVFRQRTTGTAKGPNGRRMGRASENETLRYVCVRRSALSANCVRTWISILLRSYYQMRKLNTKTTRQIIEHI